MSSYIKSQDPNHLVSVGDEGYMCQSSLVSLQPYLAASLAQPLTLLFFLLALTRAGLPQLGRDLRLLLRRRLFCAHRPAVCRFHEHAPLSVRLGQGRRVGHAVDHLPHCNCACPRQACCARSFCHAYEPEHDVLYVGGCRRVSWDEWHGGVEPMWPPRLVVVVERLAGGL